MPNLFTKLNVPFSTPTLTGLLMAHTWAGGGGSFCKRRPRQHRCAPRAGPSQRHHSRRHGAEVSCRPGSGHPASLGASRGSTAKVRRGRIASRVLSTYDEGRQGSPTRPATIQLTKFDWLIEETEIQDQPEIPVWGKVRRRGRSNTPNNFRTRGLHDEASLSKMIMSVADHMNRQRFRRIPADSEPT